MESEETRKLRLEVMKIAAQEHIAHGDATRAVKAANTLWNFFEAPNFPGDGRPERS